MGLFAKKSTSFSEFENEEGARVETTLYGDIDKIVKRVDNALAALDLEDLTVFEMADNTQGVQVRYLNYRKTKEEEVVEREVFLLLAAVKQEVKAVVYTEGVYLEGTKEMFRVAANALKEFERDEANGIQ